jgi:hypothetical protein
MAFSLFTLDASSTELYFKHDEVHITQLQVV